VGAASSSHAVVHSVQEVSVRVTPLLGETWTPTRPRRIRCHDLSRASGALDVVLVVHPMVVDPSRSPTQLEESRARYGSATTARVTSLCRMVWKSRSCARLDLPRLPWSMRLNLSRQLYGLPRPSTAAAAAVASLAATAAARHPCVPFVVAGSRKCVLFLVALLVFSGVHAVPPIL
jgi:hypothetical protein